MVQVFFDSSLNVKGGFAHLSVVDIDLGPLRIAIKSDFF